MGLCWTGPYVPCRARWVGPTVLLCCYGFCSMMRPLEPFMTGFLTGTYKNLTVEQVTRQVNPVWIYSAVVLLVPVLLVTDFLRYKPVIVLQALAHLTGILLLTLGSGLRSAQSAFFCYGVAAAADAAYLSYVYAAVEPCYYQRATSYIKGAVMLGSAVGSLLGQLRVSLLRLAFLTAMFLAVALVTSCFLPMPKSGLSLTGPQQGSSGEDVRDSDGHGFSLWLTRVTAAKPVEETLGGFLSDCRKCYSSVAVVSLCMWAATGRCGFYQVVSYVQVLWVRLQPHNSTAYNGGVDAVGTLTGAAGTFAVGHVPLQWSIWGELVLGGFTFLIAVALFLMDWTGSIWMSYTCFILFKTVYMPLSAICTFQIAKTLTRRRYVLVFGVNGLAATVLQSVLTAIVINSKSLELTITSQFFIYSAFFAAMALLFTVRGVHAVIHEKRLAGGNQAERAAANRAGRAAADRAGGAAANRAERAAANRAGGAAADRAGGAAANRAEGSPL